jgi:probable rRNA maturation factor
MMKHEIGVKIDGRLREVVNEDRLRGVAGRVLAAENTPPAAVSNVVTGDAMVRDLNRRYCGEDAPTDVLSFALREGTEEFVLPPGESLRLGEVVISLPTARRQARQAGHSVEREVALLLIHGLLHLLGYDHAVAADRQRMESRQDALLASLGVL